MIENQKVLLYIAMAFICFSLWTAWQKDYPKTPVATTTPAIGLSSTPASASSIALIQNHSLLNTTQTNQSATKSIGIITVKTDVITAKIDPVGGNLISLTLPKYPKSLDQPNSPTALLSNDSKQYYIAESALLGKQGPDKANTKAIYTADSNNYVLPPDAKSLNIKLTWTDNNGLTVTKTYTFQQNSYLINVSYAVDNQSSENYTANLYTQLTRNNPQANSKSYFQVHPYIGAAVSSPEDRYQEISFNKMQEEPLNMTAQNGWAAMVEHYFLSAWIPDNQTSYRYYSNATNGIYSIGMISPNFTVAPNQQKIIQAQLYAGPEIADHLAKIAPGLDQTVSYGWLWPISVGIFWLMKNIYHFIGNWGWSIIIVTILIKLAFYHLSATSYRSMAKMRKVQPKIEAIRERYADDKQKLSQAMMELYKTDKINPLGGCLPIVVQIPVFFALYMVLVETVQLRQAPFIGWIHDLSIPDPFFILPIIMGITMFIQQKLNPAPADPTQAKVMMFLPLVFTFIFIHFPAGLVLYWVVNNTLSILQQWYVMRQVDQEQPNKKKTKK